MDTDVSPITILDSGIGGLPYLERIRALLPYENYQYLADTRNFPYGTKRPDELVDVLTALVRRLIGLHNPKALVLACNTASVVALSELRKTFKLPIIGVVPAVKPAVAVSRNRRIGLLATSRTVLDSYTDDLIRSFASDCYIERIGDGDIVEFVENHILDADVEVVREAVRSVAQQFISAEIDTLVLGCTHFIFVREALLDLLSDGTRIVDSREGVAKQVARVIGNNRRDQPGSDRPKLYTTGVSDNNSRYRGFAGRFDCEFAGVFE